MLRIFFFAMLFVLAPVFESIGAHIGLGVSQSVDGEIAASLQGDIETPTIDVDFAYQGIDFHDAQIETSYRFETGLIDFTVFQENDFTGYTLGNMNRSNDLGVSAIAQFRGLEWELALFGRNGNTAAPIVRYDEDTGEIISEVPGLTPVEGTYPNVSVATHYDVGRVEGEAKVLSNIANSPTPQWLLSASTAGDIGPFQWVLSGVYRGQRHAGKFQNEISSMLTLGFAL